MRQPDARILFAHILVIVFLLAAFSYAGNNRWTSGGPYGGSISQFAFTPLNKNLLFISGKSVYRSTNSGTQWERMELEDFGATKIQDYGAIVRVHPANPGTVVAAGYHVFASINQGDTWKVISILPFQGSLLNDLKFHPADPQILAGVSDKGFFISGDGGRTWSAKNQGMATVGGVKLEFDPVNGDTLYVLQRQGRFYKSTDRGNSWKSFSTGLPSSNGRGLAADPKRSGVLYASFVDQVYKTENGGAQWSRTTCNCHVRSLVVDPNDSRNVYGAGDDAVRSTNGGGTWGRMNIPRLTDTRLLGVGADPFVRNSILIGTQGEGVFRSLNSGITWSRINNGLDALNIRSFSLSGRGPNQIFAVGQIQLFRTKDGGNNWTLGYTGTSPLDSTFAVQVHPLDGNFVGVAGCCTMAISINGGASYRTVRLTSSGAPLQSGTVAMDPVSTNRMFITSLTFPDFRPLGILRTTDQGRTFQDVNNGIDTSQKIRTIVADPKQGQIILAGTNKGQIYRSTNGGNSWANSSNGLRAGDVTSISIDPDDISNSYAVSGKLLYKSTNGGVSWNVRPVGAGITPTFVAVDTFKPSRIFAGTFGGLLISRDFGQTWGAFSSAGLEHFLVTSMMNDPRVPNSFYIGTDRGIYHYKIAPPTSGPNVPLIDQLSPPATSVGKTMTVNGTGFGATQGSSRVSFTGANAATVVSWSDSKIQLQIPSGIITGDVVVETPGGKSNGYQFVVVSPNSGTVEPTGGPAAGGTRVSIRLSTPLISSALLVMFGDVVATKVQLTPPDVITCDVPPGSGTVDVFVLSISAGRLKVGTFNYQ